RRAAISAGGTDGAAFRAVKMARINLLCTIDTAAVEIQLRSIREGVFHAVRVEVLIDVRRAVVRGLVMTSADGLCLHGPRVLHPAEMIDVVNVKIVEASAARPDEAVEPPDLIVEFADIRGLGRRSECRRRSVHAIAAHEDNLADRAVANALAQFLE